MLGERVLYDRAALTVVAACYANIRELTQSKHAKNWAEKVSQKKTFDVPLVLLVSRIVVVVVVVGGRDVDNDDDDADTDDDDDVDANGEQR